MLMKDMKNNTTTHREACEAVKAKFPKPVAQVREETGRSYSKGEYARFKRFIAVIARYNDNDEDASAPYCEAFKYLRKSIKKFAKNANIDIMEIE